MATATPTCSGDLGAACPPAGAAVREPGGRPSLAARVGHPQPRRAGAAPAAAPAGSGNAAMAGRGGLFGGKAGCAGCHQVDGRGGIVRTGSLQRGQESTGPAAEKAAGSGDGVMSSGRGAALQMLVARTRDGREIRRRPAQRGHALSVQVVDASGALHLLDKLDTRQLSRGEHVDDAGRLREPADVSGVGRPRRVSAARRDRAVGSNVPLPSAVDERRLAGGGRRSPTTLADLLGRLPIRTPSGLKQIDAAERPAAARRLDIPDAWRLGARKRRRSSSTA